MASVPVSPPSVSSVSVSSAKPATTRADVLVLGVRSDDDKEPFADLLSLLSFTGADDQVVTFPSGGLAKAPLVVAVALPEAPTAEDLRRAAARGIRAVKGGGTVALALHPAGVDDVEAIAEGIGLGLYSYDTYKTQPKTRPTSKTKSTPQKPSVKAVTILTPFARQTRTNAALERAAIVAASVNQARDWVNTPPGDLTPPEFARQIGDYVAGVVDGDDVKVSIWDEKRLAKERCGGILGVGAGSDSPPRLVKLTYTPEGATKHLALVGKGITFDSGGLSIKPGGSMMTMKIDMGGAAAVVAATVAIARLGLPVAVSAYACIAENMPSGSATRPGDVLTMRNGSTVEVHNTDAEGRLVLADGLALAVEAKADVILDAATLTGAQVVALGERTSAVLSNDDDLCDAVYAASRAAGESFWPLPITEEMKGKVHSSKIADLRQHNPSPYGGTLFAAAFLREFVGDTPWAHLDIAGPAFNDGGPYDYVPSGGTGVAVRTLVTYATIFAGS